MTESQSGRPPINSERMSKAEYQRRYRAKKKLESKAEGYFVIPEAVLEQLTVFASAHKVKRGDLMSSILQGQLKNLSDLETVLAPIESSQPERTALIRSQALELIRNGRGMDVLFKKFVEETKAKILKESGLSPEDLNAILPQNESS